MGLVRQMFTYGSDHSDENHDSLLGYYTVIAAETKQQCRAIQIALHGRKWSHQYDLSEATEMIEKYDLKCIEDIVLDIVRP